METEAWRELEEWLSESIEPVVAASRALAHAGMLDLRIKAHLEAERSRLLGETGAPQAWSRSAEVPSADGGQGQAVAVAVGSLHMRHIFVGLSPDDPYMAVERVSRKGESDLIEVRTNLAHPALGTVADRAGFACQNLAEAAAIELGADFLPVKSTVLAKLLAEKSLSRALVASWKDSGVETRAGRKRQRSS